MSRPLGGLAYCPRLAIAKSSSILGLKPDRLFSPENGCPSIDSRLGVHGKFLDSKAETAIGRISNHAGIRKRGPMSLWEEWAGPTLLCFHGARDLFRLR